MKKERRDEIEEEMRRKGLTLVEAGSFQIPLPADNGEVSLDDAVIASTKALMETAHNQMDAQRERGEAIEFIVTGKLSFGGGATCIIALSFTPPPEEVPEKPPVPFVNITGASSKGGH